MSRKFIAAVLACSLAVTGFAAAPARADDQDLARIIGTVATLAVIGAAISQAQNDGQPAIKVHDSWRYGSKPMPRVIGPAPGAPRFYERRQQALPKTCMLEVAGGRSRYVLSKPCLKQNRVHTDELPRSCQITVRTRHGDEKAFEAGCLRRKGYEIGNDRRTGHVYNGYRNGGTRDAHRDGGYRPHH